MRILRPRRSASEPMGRRNHPPIWAPVPPAGSESAEKSASSRSIAARPPPSSSQAFCWRVSSPNGTQVSKASAAFLPV